MSTRADYSNLRPAEPFDLRLEFDCGDANARLSVSGELDLAAIERVGDALEQIESREPEKLEIDLAALSFIDVTGVRAIASTCQRALEGGCTEVSIRPGPRAVQRVFVLLGLADELPFVEL